MIAPHDKFQCMLSCRYLRCHIENLNAQVICSARHLISVKIAQKYGYIFESALHLQNHLLMFSWQSQTKFIG